MSREQRVLVLLSAVVIVLAVDLFCVKAANGAPARLPEKPANRIAHIARTMAVTSKWQSVLEIYTGGSYGVDHVNALWPRSPHGQKRKTIIGAAIHHHVPARLLLGVWGAESGFGAYACNFGLTGYFPGTGTSGSFWKDAHLAAELFDRLYRSRYGRRAF